MPDQQGNGLTAATSAATLQGRTWASATSTTCRAGADAVGMAGETASAAFEAYLLLAAPGLPIGRPCIPLASARAGPQLEPGPAFNSVLDGGTSHRSVPETSIGSDGCPADRAGSPQYAVAPRVLPVSWQVGPGPQPSTAHSIIIENIRKEFTRTWRRGQSTLLRIPGCLRRASEKAVLVAGRTGSRNEFRDRPIANLHSCPFRMPFERSRSEPA